MEHNDWLKLLQDVDYDFNILAGIGIDGLQRDNGMETSTNPDSNIPAEEPVDNAPDPGPSQARSSEARNTGNDQGVRECRRGGCQSPAVPGIVECEKHRKETNEYSAKRRKELKKKGSMPKNQEQREVKLQRNRQPNRIGAIRVSLAFLAAQLMNVSSKAITKVFGLPIFSSSTRPQESATSASSA
ncbi:unnamed protein product [Fusarium fujikuroi]|uniref:Uncharacterized protein n=1 Tax=Fusarium fujikuroi TaxID=5127 RepID=A0A9Q9RLZ4_FUSFU|nr:unnamed protein product [Fusarium fujikuroi]VZH87502.1 unnamed protein product [Fusarium fujikuroi]